MGWLKEVWRSNVSQSLFELGHINFQKKAWMAKIPNYVGSYEEAIERLADCAIPQHLNDFFKDGFCSRDEMNALIRIDNLMDAIIPLDLNDPEEVWKSDIWLEIEKESKETFYKSFFHDFLHNLEPQDKRFDSYLETSNK